MFVVRRINGRPAGSFRRFLILMENRDILHLMAPEPGPA
jgi:hypothetical protein